MRIDTAPVVPQVEYRLFLSFEELEHLENILNAAISHLAMSQADAKFGGELRSRIIDQIPF